MLRRALEEPPPDDKRGELLLELGLAEAAAGAGDPSTHLRQALTLLTDPELRALAAATLGRTLLFSGDLSAASEVARSVAAEIGADHPDLRDQLEAFALTSAWFDDRAPAADEATAHLRDAVPGPGATTGARMLAAVAAYGWSNVSGPRDACVRLALAALAEDALVDADNGLLNILAVCALAHAEHPDAVSSLESALGEAHRRGSLSAAAGNQLWLSYARFLRSELEDAVAAGRLALEQFNTWGNEAGPEYVAAFLVMALVARGELEEARSVLNASRVPDRLSEGARLWHQAHLQLLEAERRDDEALELADRLEREFGHVSNPVGTTWRLTRAVLRARMGDEAGARADVDAQLELALAWGAPSAIGQARRVRAELFDEDLSEPIELLEGAPQRLELAKALFAHGSNEPPDVRITLLR